MDPSRLDYLWWQETLEAGRAASLLYYRDRGIDPKATLNWLLRLGWGPTVDDRNVRAIDLTRAVRLFLDGGRMRPSPANMDPKPLDALDRKYKGQREKVARLALVDHRVRDG
jgi:hypothetical protein